MPRDPKKTIATNAYHVSAVMERTEKLWKIYHILAVKSDRLERDQGYVKVLTPPPSELPHLL
jgi:hypothetical protein